MAKTALRYFSASSGDFRFNKRAKITIVDPNNRIHSLKDSKVKSDQRIVMRHHVKKSVRYFSRMSSDSTVLLLGQRHRSETKGITVSTT